MKLSEYLSLAMSALALIIAFIGWASSRKYSHLNLLHTVQDMMLQKAKDCNLLYEKISEKPVPQFKWIEFEDEYSPVISEATSGFKLLENLLERYSLGWKKEFFLEQFWLQLNESVRSYLMNLKEIENYDEINQKKIRNIQEEFKPFASF